MNHTSLHCTIYGEKIPSVIYVHEENVKHFSTYANQLVFDINWKLYEKENTGSNNSRCYTFKLSCSIGNSTQWQVQIPNDQKLSHIVKSSEVKMLTKKTTFLDSVQSIAKDFQCRFLINIHIFPVIHGPSVLFHLTLITLLSDRWFFSSCIEGFYPTAAPKN